MLWRNLCSNSAWTGSCRVGGTTEQAKRKLLGLLHWTEPSSRCAVRHTGLLILAPYSFISALDWVPPRPQDKNLSEKIWEMLSGSPIERVGKENREGQKITRYSRKQDTVSSNWESIRWESQPGTGLASHARSRKLQDLPSGFGWGSLPGRH